MNGSPWAQWCRDNPVAKDVITTRRGWNNYVHRPPRQPFETLSRREMALLDEDDLDDYNAARAIWNGNLPTIKTQQLTRAFSIMDQVMASNVRDSEQQRTNIVIDAAPGLGKTTIAQRYARQFHRGIERRHGTRTDSGNLRVPAAFLSVEGATTLKGLNQRLLNFYGHTAAQGRLTSQRLEDLAVDCVSACETQLIVIDELHFVDFRHRNGIELSNHLKSWSNEMPATFIYVGVNLRAKRFFDEGMAGDNVTYTQTSSRSVRCDVVPHDISTTAGFRAWVDLLNTFENHLMLTDQQPGMLANQAREIYRRTQGRIGSLTGLLNRGCQVAVSTHTEALTPDVIDQVVLDNAANTSLAS
ncbi:ATP-binding protein [Luteococcus sp.]|uniref:ATP-binding protein n=1 Tax=Luteococcus sp. TaxID=1969402 RepID=UPI0037370227